MKRVDGEQRDIVRGLGPILSGLIAVGLIVLTLMVAVLIGMQEQALVASAGPATNTPVAVSDAPTPQDTPSPEPTATASPSPVPSATPSPTPTPTLLPPPLVADCPLPEGWVLYPIQEDDTLYGLAMLSGTDLYTLMKGNCLDKEIVLPVGRMLNIPYNPARTACPPPPRWQKYQVMPGDTLSQIASRFGTTVASLKSANCLTGDLLVVGWPLWVPPTPTRAIHPTRWPTYTPLPSPTDLPTATQVVTSTATLTGTPPAGTGTPTATSGPTGTAGPTSTSGPTGTVGPTETTGPTSTAGPSPTLGPTVTGGPTSTPVPSTGTPEPPTSTPNPATSTPEPTVPVPPTSTPVPPTPTPIPPASPQPTATAAA